MYVAESDGIEKSNMQPTLGACGASLCLPEGFLLSTLCSNSRTNEEVTDHNTHIGDEKGGKKTVTGRLLQHPEVCAKSGLKKDVSRSFNDSSKAR